MDSPGSEFSAPLCLENICRINIFFRLEEYPVQQLLLLPLSVRRDLFLHLPPIDVLHYNAAGLFHDFDTAGVVERIHQDLLNATLGDDELKTLLSHSLLLFLVPKKCQLLPHPNMVLKHISESYSSLPFSVSVVSTNVFLIPNRISCFILLRPPRLRSHALFLQYCNVIPPKEFTVNLDELCISYLWSEWTDNVDDIRGSEVVELVNHDPVIPFLQFFLNQVETIEMVSNMNIYEYADTDWRTDICSTAQSASYLVLYNILTSQHPCLKHIKIRGGVPREIVESMLVTVKKFCSDHGNYFPNSEEFPVLLATPAPGPYFLKSLSITHVEDTDTGSNEPWKNFCLDHEYAVSISSLTREIIVFQLHSLEQVSINLGTSFCYRKGMKDEFVAEKNYSISEYRQLLSTLTDLLKQPQLQSLSVGRAPLNEAYQMIEVFLYAQANHNQSLTIECVEVESKWKCKFINEDDKIIFDLQGTDQVWRLDKKMSDAGNELQQTDKKDGHSVSVPAIDHPLRHPPAQPLPDSNGALKSLNIGCSCDRLHAWLFSIPNLHLKELQTSRPDLVPSSGVAFTVINTSVKI